MASYRFFLDSNHVWSFLATPDTEPWLRKFASIFRLKKNARKCAGSIVFSRKISIHQGCLIEPAVYPKLLGWNLPKTGWNEENFKTLQFFTHPKTKIVLVTIGKPLGKIMDLIRMGQALYPVYEKILVSGGLPVHSALLEKEGKGVILVASGATGKSTCARRVPPPWRALADDETVLIKNGRHFDAHPFPTWSEHLWKRSQKNWDASKKVRLAGIFFLKQAVRDKAEPVGRGQAAAFLTQSACQSMNRILMRLDKRKKRRLQQKIFENACRTASSAPAFILHVSLTGRFWEEIENVLE
ncbi:MAG: SynChlorMet cassette protein ScmC [Candidatus Omnitrophica bacterium]|nr:SynChlorMet cassette protein ScmC [Candidatus Omnitrophota bacterium]